MFNIFLDSTIFNFINIFLKQLKGRHDGNWYWEKFKHIIHTCNVDMLDSKANYLLNAMKMNTIILTFCIILAVCICFVLFNVLITFSKNPSMPNRVHENSRVEYLVMIVPMIITYILIIASIGAIYAMDQPHDCDIYINIVASQWKWTYSIDQDINIYKYVFNINYDKIIKILNLSI